MDITAAHQLTDWRRSMARLYEQVRGAPDPQTGHELWRAGRDELFRHHPQSPLPARDPMRRSGIPYWPYRAELRLQLPIAPVDEPLRYEVDTGIDGVTVLEQLGTVRLPDPLAATIAVWWLPQYGGGLFLPLRDGTAGDTSYGAGRYLLDTAKSADLGGTQDGLGVDLNFLYHPSCRYDPSWVCPLAPPENRISAPVEAGERLA